ncbi:hypothetical protein ES703_00695 [subsurface metagenome]
MRLPKRGEKGFTLIELLIVVAILGVLAAVVIPNVSRFIGSGEEEARATELANIQAAVTSMMVDNELATLPTPLLTGGGVATNDMTAFPDGTSACEVLKLKDPDGNDYVAATDKAGYMLYGHDITGGTAGTDVNYVATATTASYYTVDANGTVSQWQDAIETPYPA